MADTEEKERPEKLAAAKKRVLMAPLRRLFSRNRSFAGALLQGSIFLHGV